MFLQVTNHLKCHRRQEVSLKIICWGGLVWGHLVPTAVLTPLNSKVNLKFLNQGDSGMDLSNYHLVWPLILPDSGTNSQVYIGYCFQVSDQTMPVLLTLCGYYSHCVLQWSLLSASTAASWLLGDSREPWGRERTCYLLSNVDTSTILLI
jgi:hypothetical protein